MASNHVSSSSTSMDDSSTAPTSSTTTAPTATSHGKQLQALAAGFPDLDPLQYDSALRLLSTLQAKNDAEVVEYDSKNHEKLMKFWSTRSSQRTAKFKQIVLAKHIELHDFDAIFENSWGGADQSHYYYPAGKEEVNINTTKIYLPLHLTLGTNARHELSTLDWNDHRLHVTIDEASYPVDFKQTNSKVTLSWPGSESYANRDEDYGDNEPISSGCFDYVRQLFFDNPKLDAADADADAALIDQKAKYPDILHEINADNIDTYDLSLVNIYHLAPKDKQMTYFWNSIKSRIVRDVTVEEFFALSVFGDWKPMWFAWSKHVIDASFDFETVKVTKLVVKGKDFLAGENNLTDEDYLEDYYKQPHVVRIPQEQFDMLFNMLRPPRGQ